MNADQFESRRDRSIGETKKKGLNPIVPLVIILLLITAGFGAFFLMKKNKPAQVISKTESPTAAPTEAPAPTEETIDTKSVKIQVLNGTEVAGEAGKVKSMLADEGFNVVATGNADKTTYTKVIVQAKTKVPAGFVTKLKTLLQKNYEIGADEELQSDNENDVVVIIGIANDKQKVSSDSATAKPTTAAKNENTTPTAAATASPTPKP